LSRELHRQERRFRPRDPASQLLKVLEGTPVAVLHPHDADGEVILREVRRLGCIVHATWPVPESLPETLGGLVCLLDSNVRRLLVSLGREWPAPMVGVMPRGEPEKIRLLRDCAPHALICKPIMAEHFTPAMYLARHIFQYQNRLQKRISKLDETLKSIRRIEQAKSILMKHKNLNEHEAYHFMRRQAMELRIPIGAIATTIIEAHRIYG